MLSPEWLSAFVAVGKLRGKDQWAAAGAGVLIAARGVLWLVTAGHVIDEVGESDVALLLTRSATPGVSVLPLGAIQRAQKLDWVRDRSADVACALMPLPEGVKLKAVARENCIDLAELVPSMQSYTVGCPYGLAQVDQSSAVPLVLDGIIAGTNPKDGTVFTSAPTFPGNSGGPLVVVRVPFNPAGGLVVGRPTVFLAGIILQSALVRPQADQGLPALHLGVARAIGVALSLIESAAATEQLRRIGAKSVAIDESARQRVALTKDGKVADVDAVYLRDRDAVVVVADVFGADKHIQIKDVTVATSSHGQLKRSQDVGGLFLEGFEWARPLAEVRPGRMAKLAWYFPAAPGMKALLEAGKAIPAKIHFELHPNVDIVADVDIRWAGKANG